MLGEGRQTQKTTYKLSDLYECLAKGNVQRQNADHWLSVLGQEWGLTADRHVDFYWGDEMSRIWIMVTAARRGRCPSNHCSVL